MSVPTRGLIERLLVVLPNWVGDVVLASPVLAALRAHFRSATIAYLLRRYVAETWADRRARTGKGAYGLRPCSRL